jgi:hypothetical protein
MDVLNQCEITNGHLHNIPMDNDSSNYSMTHDLNPTLQVSGIKWPVCRNHIPCITHVIQPTFGAFMCCLSVKCHTKSWQAHDNRKEFAENANIDIGNSQRLQNEAIGSINVVSDMRSVLRKNIK